MKFEIKHRFSDDMLFSCESKTLKLAVSSAIRLNADLRSADLRYANLCSADLRSANLSSTDLSYADLSYADLSSADLRSADLSYVNLRYANLCSADLRSANLSSANLHSANLRYADLRSADLRSANLHSAKNLNKFITTPLYILQSQVGKIRAYKIVNEKNEGPYQGGIIYNVGKTYSVKIYDTDENHPCGAGINLATLGWCIKEWRVDYKILLVEFTAKDIVAIPIGSDGKFRVKKCKIVKRVNLKEIELRT